MHEVEVKAALENKEGTIKRLAELGCELGVEIVQDDMVYARDVSSLENYLKNSDFLRLRTQDETKTLFTFKHHPGRITDLNSAPLELELLIDSRATMEQILSLMGYQEAVRTIKRRRKGKYKDWEVCIDEVVGLGSFIELEELTHNREETASIQERMKNFLAELGIDSDKYLRYRYDVLLLQQKHSMGGVS